MSTPIIRRASEQPSSKIARSSPLRRGSSQLSPSQSQTKSTGSGVGAATATADQRRARREQLRNFYGIKESPAESKSEESVRGGDPLDIDSSSFNASAYYDDLISNSTLSQLMKKASELSLDIGNLEGSRHSLVYNHHHQLFAAGDTISHLNSRTPQLLSIVTELQQSFSSISQLVDSVATSSPISENTNTDDDDNQKVVQRLRLMILAQESPKTIRDYYIPLQIRLTSQAEKGDEQAKKVLEECQALIDTLPSNSNGDGLAGNES